MKPDGGLGYGFAYGGELDFYTESVPAEERLYRVRIGFRAGLEITTPDLRERYQAFAYAVESRSRSLGQCSNRAFSSHNFDLNLPPLRYLDRPYDHSRQYRSTVMDERKYYNEIMQDAGL